jgi:hypothetical protein
MPFIGCYLVFVIRAYLNSFFHRLRQRVESGSVEIGGIDLRLPPVTEKASYQDNGLKSFIYMVSQAGFEPATFPLGGGCSIQLSY